MNKPCYAAILEHSPTKPALIFVSSRRQTRLTALDLIAYCASDDNPKQFLHMPEDEIEAIAATLQVSGIFRMRFYCVEVFLDDKCAMLIPSLFLFSLS